ncbi:DUF523 domain-containing protein [Desulfovibrio oxyclinae]|uniref:DUF523 domain-containing protein n=1 Tax=Desulfovibrio oxyclinae TaxID=63560 RepID=UPI000372205F|nr:DUF523 domain-containing protein [Desulfovibrio oxyclinae]
MRDDMILVSACLAGVKCRYDGGDNEHPDAVRLVEQGRAIPVCPEQLGGLPTPRNPVEIRDDRVVDESGTDFTEHFRRGAREAVKLAVCAGCRTALLQPRSPSCGCGMIYDGTFQRRLIPGDGFLARALRRAGIEPVAAEDRD